MEPQDKRILHALLREEKTAALGVVMERSPYVGMVPFVWVPERSLAVIHTSSLAQHSRGLYSGAPFSLMVQSARWEGDALRTPRVTLNGEATLLLPNTALHADCRRRYLERFPKSAITFSLKDFSLFGLYVREARLVAGFGRAYTLSTDALKAAFEV